ncbi:transposase [Streptomyces yokosukanensis]
MTGRPPTGRTWGRRGITPRVKVSGRKSERRSLGERDYVHLLDGAHQLLKAPLIVVWDRLSTHVSKTMKALVAEREWLTVVLLPGYAPELNPVEALWAHIKRSLANLTAHTLTELEILLRQRLKALQYRHGILGGFLAGTGLTLDEPDGLSYAEVSRRDQPTGSGTSKSTSGAYC